MTIRLLVLTALLLSLIATDAFGQAPTITSISPTEGPVGSLVTITGTNLDNLIALSIAGVTGLEVSNDGNTLVGFVMPGATTGTVDVTTSYFGSTTVSSSQSFTVDNPSATPALQLGTDIDGQAANDESGYSVSLSADGQRLAVGSPGNDGTGADAGQVRIYEWSGSTWGQVGLDIDGEAAGDNSGWAVSISADGQRVAIGALGNNGFTGHVRVYEWSGTAWGQIGLDIDGEAAGDQSGYSVSLSADGQRVAIGARLNAANGTNSGHVRIYQDNAGVWTQIGVDIDGENANDQSAFSVSLSANGQRVAIGAPFNAGNGTRAGHVRIFEDIAGTWTQVGVDINGEVPNEEYGWSVSLSADGQRVAIGATAVLTGSAGYVRIYEWSGSNWDKIADIDGETADDRSGISVSLSGDGQRVAIGARLNAGNGTDAGHVRIYEDIVGIWSQIVDDIDGEAAGNESGRSVSLSADGQRVAIGAPFNNGNGISAGHVRSFQLVNPLNLTNSTPATNANNIATNANISLDFNFPVDGTTANATNIKISGQQTGTITGIFSGGGSNTIIFDPANDFKSGELITVTITSGLQGVTGEIAVAETFQFTTASATATAFISETAISTTQTGNALADLDGDGNVDVISASNSLVWLQNDGAGNFVELPISPNGAGLVTAQDLDGDGDMDVIVSYTDNDDVTWFENDGSENFTELVIQPPLAQQTDESLFALDFDLDGDIDLLTSKFENPDIVWYENDGLENFSRNVITSFAENGQNKVYPIDVDGDGDIDFLNNYEFTGEISWYENDGSQLFTQNVISTNGDGGALFAMDIDGDGDVDVLTTSSNGIVWFENNGSQSFTENTIDATASASLTAADIDGDGDIDVMSASANGASSTIDVYTNNGSEVFTMNTLTTGNIGLEVKVADMNNDGDLDVIGSFFFGDVILFENATPPLKVTSINPISGPVGTEVTISGTDFNSTPANNIVYFGATMATVTAASATELTTSVPLGATYSPITVLDNTNGLMSASPEIFNPTFTPFKPSIEVTDFDPKTDFSTDGQANTSVISDFDGDGKTDIIVRVQLIFPTLPEISIFRNTSTSGAVSYAPKVDLTIGYTAGITAGDLDGDGKPDLILSNFVDNTISVLRNTSSVGSISFAAPVDFITAAEPFQSAIGDLDGDGKPDIAVVNNVDAVVSVLLNQSTPGSISFAAKADFATGPSPRHIIINDLDGDGKLDLASANFSNTISVLRNSGSLGVVNFEARIDLTATAFGNIRTISVGDLDGDGKADLVTANASDPNLSVFRNISSPGTINFESNIDLISGSSPSSVIISDFNGDSKADIAAVNTSSSSASISIYKNNSLAGSIDFANHIELPIEPNSITDWIGAGDVDGDGRIDIISSKSFPSPYSISVFRNNPIIPPLLLDTSLPAANATSVNRNAIIELDFDADIDLLSVNSNSTNANEVYDDNIKIFGNQSGQLEGVYAIGADNSILLFTPSNDFKAGEKITVTITANILGIGGEDAAPTSFSFIAASGPFEGAFIERDLGILGLAQGSFDWGDYDGDGNLDVITVGYDEDYNNTVALVYRNNGGVFTDIGASITGVYYSDVDWGDYDNDGDLDLVIAGETDGGIRLTTIYQNNAGLFTDIGAGLEGADYASVEWGDYDNDGDLDLIVAGRTSIGPTTASTKIYNNEGGVFTDINAGLPGLYLGSADWGDYDGDGDLDLLLAGFDVSSGRFSVIYDNNNGIFSDHLAGLPGIARGNASWGDYDNDNDLDILLVGDGPVLTYSTILNNDAGVFTDITAAFPTTSDGGGTWADFDGDGLLDVMITGIDYSSSNEITDIFRNNGSGSFTNINARLNPIPDLGRAQFIDYDGDGDLDLLTAGEIFPTPFTSATLYENTTFPIFYSQSSGAFDSPALWNSAADGSGFNPISSNFTDGKTDFIIQNGDVMSAASAAISMNNFTILEGGTYENGNQDISINRSTSISGTFSDLITLGESYFYGTLTVEPTGSFTATGTNNSSFHFYNNIINRGTFNLANSTFWYIEADLTIINESASAFILSDLNSGLGYINANLTIADFAGGGDVLLRSADFIRMAANTTLRNELGDYPTNSRVCEIAELRATSGTASFENASNAIVLIREGNLGTFDAINFDFTATDNLVRYFSNGNVLAVDHYHMALTAGATSLLLGTINVFGDLTIENGNVLDANGSDISIAGNWNNNNAIAGFLAGAGTVSFNGVGMDPQLIIGNTNFNNLVINNTGSSRKVTANDTIAIASSLNLTSGVLELTDGNLLSLSAAATVSGTFGISEMIQMAPTSAIRKYVDGPGSFAFPIGTANIYNETNLSLATGTIFNGVTGSRYVDLNLVGSEAPNLINSGLSLSKYWTVSSVNVNNVLGSLSLTYDGLDAVNGEENNYLAAVYNGTWSTASDVDPATNTIAFNFSGAGILDANYTAGELPAFAPSPAIEVLAGSTAVTSGGTITLADAEQPNDATQTFTINNTGTADLVISSAILNNGAPYTVSTIASPIAAGSATTFTVTLDGATAGTFADVLTIATNDANQNSFVINLSGTITTPAIEVLAGTTAVSSGSTITLADAEQPNNATQTFTINNTGTADLVISSATFNNGAPYTVSTIASPIAPGNAATFTVTLDGATAGTFTDVLTIANNDGDESNFVINLSGTITPMPVPEIEVLAGVTAITSGDTETLASVVQPNDATQIFTINNTGTANLIISNATLTTGTVYSVSSITSPIAPGTAATFTVTLDGTAAGSFTDVLTIANNDTDESSFVINLSGTVTQANGQEITVSYNGSPLIAGAGTIAFGDLTQGVQASETFTIENTGTNDLVITEILLADGSIFTFNGLNFPITLGPGESLDISMLFNTDNVGAFTDTITINSNDPNLSGFEVGLSGNVIPVPVPIIEVSRQQQAISNVVQFGTVQQNSSTSLSFDIANIGTAALQISEISSTSDQFSLSPISLPLNVAAGTSTSFQITFNANQVGVFESTITITSNDPNQTSFTFEVRAVVSGGRAVVIITNPDNTTERIIISDEDINLGQTPFNLDLVKVFGIENLSDSQELTINSITTDNPLFTVSEIPTSIAAGEWEQFNLTLNSKRVGINSSQVTVSTSINDFSFNVVAEVIEEGEPELLVYNVITPNGDNRHDFLFIENIDFYPNNKVTIFNRWGNTLFTISNYDNIDQVFRGVTENGEELLTGNYYYVIDKGNGDERLKGFFFIQR